LNLFFFKTPRKHNRDIVKPIHSHENIKNRPKTGNPPKTKKLHELIYDFFMCFQSKKKISNLNYPRHIEPFGIKNDHFGGWIPHQHTLSLSKPEFDDFLSLLQPKKN
jgi:hypothetical protein